MDFLFPKRKSYPCNFFFRLPSKFSVQIVRLGGIKNYYKGNLKKYINGKVKFASIARGVVYLILDKITIKLV